MGGKSVSKLTCAARIGAAIGVALSRAQSNTCHLALGAFLLGGASLAALSASAEAQTAQPDKASPLPEVTVTGEKSKKPKKTAKKGKDRSQESASQPVSAQAASAQPVDQSTGTGSVKLDGSAKAGYRTENSTASGPIWGGMSVQDAPYSISVVPSQLIENVQASQPEDVYKLIPQITNVLPQQNISGNPFAYVRGFSITQFTNGAGVAYDGLLGGAGGMFNTVLEDKERVELLSGVSGFLYGTGSVGGVINNVLKRPTEQRYDSVTVGTNSGENGYIHGDFGGRVGDVGYRINLVGQDGDTSWSGQKIERDLVSAAFDFHVAPGVLLQINGAHSDYKIRGQTPTYWTSLNPLPAPADPSTLLAPTWAVFENHTDTAGVKLTWKFNNAVTFRTAYEYTHEVRPTQGGVFTEITDYSGSMTQTALDPGEEIYWNTHSGYAFVDTAFSTFGINHKMTAGFTGFVQYAADKVLYKSFGYPTFDNNFYDQKPFPAPSTTIYSAGGLGYNYLNNYATNFVLGDQIDIGNQFTILAGANYTSLNTSYRIPGLSSYDASKATPTVSAIYRVFPWLSTYASFQESLQPGVSVLNSFGTVYTNNGEVLPPYVGTQYEVGAKATVADNLLLTVALFDIDKANQYVRDNGDGTFTYIQSGREKHKGIEFTATGKLFSDLTIFGGVTLLDPRITSNPTDPSQNGDLAQGVSKVSGKLYAEYDLPWFPGLTLVGGFQAIGNSYKDLPNTTIIPSYIVGDLGFRYETEYDGLPMTLRFNVNNFTNNAYWVTSAIEGAPRTFLATAQVKF